MKSSVRVSRSGRSISFRGSAARACFEAFSGTKLPASEPFQKPHEPEKKIEVVAVKPAEAKPMRHCPHDTDGDGNCHLCAGKEPCPWKPEDDK